MTNAPGSNRMRQILAVLVVLFTVLVTVVVGYSIYVEKLAAALIRSVYDVASTGDAQRVIATWRNQEGKQFWQESDHPGGDHNYDAQIDNMLIARLRIFEPTGVTVGFTMHDGEIRSAVVIMTTGRKPNTTSSVWVQEWFESDKTNRIHVVEKDKPWRATVEFSAFAPRSQREKAFGFNTRCLARLGGCKTAEDILPAVWQLGAPLSGGRWSEMLLEVQNGCPTRLNTTTGAGGTDDSFRNGFRRFACAG